MDGVCSVGRAPTSPISDYIPPIHVNLRNSYLWIVILWWYLQKDRNVAVGCKLIPECWGPFLVNLPAPPSLSLSLSLSLTLFFLLCHLKNCFIIPYDTRFSVPHTIINYHIYWCQVAWYISLKTYSRILWKKSIKNKEVSIGENEHIMPNLLAKSCAHLTFTPFTET